MVEKRKDFRNYHQIKLAGCFVRPSVRPKSPFFILFATPICSSFLSSFLPSSFLSAFFLPFFLSSLLPCFLLTYLFPFFLLHFCLACFALSGHYQASATNESRLPSGGGGSTLSRTPREGSGLLGMSRNSQSMQDLSSMARMQR
jgi:hypothetical protein